MNEAPAADVSQKPVSLAEIALVFFRLGTIAFGGPAAHVAMMEDEFVRRRKWLTRQEFLDRLGASNLIPGPSSTEMAIHIGFSKRGWPGLLVAGCCFIVPAAIMVALIAAGYVRYGSLPRVEHILYAIKPVVIAVVVQAFWKLARSAVKSAWLAVIGVVCTVAYLFHVQELALLAVAGIAAAGPVLVRSRRMAMLLLAPMAAVASRPDAVPFGLSRLFLTFLKISSVLFGSGYVLLAFLRSDFVDRLHWLTEKQLLDAVAVGQVTPGPVFTTATFVGYLVGGTRGAAVATVAVFLPAFILVAASGPLIPRIRRSALAGAFLDGVIIGSLALMGVVAWQLGRAAIVDFTTAAIALVSAILLFRFRVSSAWLVIGAAVVGWAGIRIG
ncbi:MAG: chromate efflux transporter [Terriglobales bacterium]